MLQIKKGNSVQFHPGKLQQARQISADATCLKTLPLGVPEMPKKLSAFAALQGNLSSGPQYQHWWLIDNCLQPKLQEIRSPVLIFVSVHMDAYQKDIYTWIKINLKTIQNNNHHLPSLASSRSLWKCATPQWRRELGKRKSWLELVLRRDDSNRALTGRGTPGGPKTGFPDYDVRKGHPVWLTTKPVATGRLPKTDETTKAPDTPAVLRWLSENY